MGIRGKRKVGIIISQIYQIDTRVRKMHTKTHNSGRNKSETSQHRDGIHTLKYQEKIRNSTKNKILKECRREMESKE